MQTARWLGIKKNLLTFLLPQQEKKFFNNESIFFLLRQRENVISSTDYHHANIELIFLKFFSLFVVDEDDHLRSPRPNYVCRSEVTNFGFELFTTTSREGGGQLASLKEGMKKEFCKEILWRTLMRSFCHFYTTSGFNKVV